MTGARSASGELREVVPECPPDGARRSPAGPARGGAVPAVTSWSRSQRSARTGRPVPHCRRGILGADGGADRRRRRTPGRRRRGSAMAERAPPTPRASTTGSTVGGRELWLLLMRPSTTEGSGTRRCRPDDLGPQRATAAGPAPAQHPAATLPHWTKDLPRRGCGRRDPRRSAVVRRYDARRPAPRPARSPGTRSGGTH